MTEIVLEKKIEKNLSLLLMKQALKFSGYPKDRKLRAKIKFKPVETMKFVEVK